MKNRRFRPFRKIAIVAGILTTGILIACIGPNYDSVHFYATWSGPDMVDFGRVPQQVMVSGWNLEPVRASTEYDNGYPQFNDFSGDALAEINPKPKEDDYRNHDQENLMRTKIQGARNLEVNGHFREAIQAFRTSSRANRIQSFAREREELLPSIKKEGCVEYLRQRYLVEFAGEDGQAKAYKAIGELKVDPSVKPFIAYTLAGRAKDQSKAYLAVADQYPTSSRAESALVMAARARVEYAAEDRDDKAAKAIFDRLLEKYPHTRFRSNIEGWLGRIELAGNHTDQAIAHYIKQSHSSFPHESWKGHQALAEIARQDGRLADASIHWLYQRSLDEDVHFRYQSSQQIRNAFDGFSAKDARLIQAKVRTNADLLKAYLDFRLEDTSIHAGEEANLLTYVSDSLKHLKNVSPVVYSRMAQLNYNSGHYAKALQMARRAHSVKGEVGYRASYVEAASLARMGQKRSAIRVYESIYRSDAPRHLRKGCAEPLAILCEDTGNYVRAYEIYDEIGYHSDAAFLADSVLSPTQLAKIVRAKPAGDERNALNYTVAMRYFRMGDYSHARSILSKMPKLLRLHKGLNPKEYNEFVQSVYFDKVSGEAIDPLNDVKKLANLRRRAENAHSQSGRAEALYEMIQFTRSRRTLMFYSAGLWKGGRADTFGLYWNKSLNKGRSERLAVAGGMEHEVDAQTVTLCHELVKRCPNSRLAPKALYTGGVAGERLSALNSWWDDHRAPVLKEAVADMKRLVRKYPHNALAKPARKYAAEFADEIKPKY